VVGVPGRVVSRGGSRVDTVDLHHEDLPDPVVEMFRCLQRRIDRLDKRVGGMEAPEPLPGDEDDAADTKKPISVEFEGWTWEI